MDNVTQKNFSIINNVMKDHDKVINQLIERISTLEGNVARLQADIMNTKQLIGHISGRGMGPTVRS